MERLIIEIESAAKAAELQAVLADLKAVKKVTLVPDGTEILAAYDEHEESKAAIVNRKNKAFAKYLS